MDFTQYISGIGIVFVSNIIGEAFDSGFKCRERSVQVNQTILTKNNYIAVAISGFVWGMLFTPPFIFGFNYGYNN